ncbi:DUF397 domain-containing protein [Nocardia sp. NBC_00511]|uniref:DUF397 domain-containing protein n=1 Tax=Nocardia sp. NBC_00511 TaxID=2903591 RepID=UPI00386C2D39
MNLSGAQWFKSSYSQAGGECVEVAFPDPDSVGVRDSKNIAGPALVFTSEEWSTFTSGVRQGKFD